VTLLGEEHPGVKIVQFENHTLKVEELDIGLEYMMLNDVQEKWLDDIKNGLLIRGYQILANRP
jgi:hypothetical protein